LSDTDDISSLIFKQTLYVPIARKDLFKAIVNELFELFRPIQVEPMLFYQPAWYFSESAEYMDFSLNPEYFYIWKNISPIEPTQLRKLEKLRTEYKKNAEKIIADTPSYISNGYPFKIHIDVLKTDESGCEIEVECHPFLYYNIVNFKNKVDKLSKRNALLRCERYLKTLATGLKAKEIDRTESDLVKFTEFLGIGRTWMSATYALQLQEVSITMVAQKKGISLERENVKRILNRKIKDKEWSFDLQYQAFTKEVKRLYDIEISSLPRFLRKMRQAVLHEGYTPKEDEKELIISVTIALLKELKKVYEAESRN
jgi:hypothetical protein